MGNVILHSSATRFSNVDPGWRTYCGLTADEVAELTVNTDKFGFSHGWRPDGRMTCVRCRLVLPRSLDRDELEAWLAS